LPEGQADVPWEKVLPLLVIPRRWDPGSEFRVPRQWFDQTARAEWWGTGFTVAEKDRLDRCLDRLLEQQQERFPPLRQRWQDWFATPFDVLCYDLASTYGEGEGKGEGMDIGVKIRNH
jgi:hypothetical protein